MRVVLEMLASLWNWFLSRFGAVAVVAGCFATKLFRYKVVSLQVATSCFAATRSRFATHLRSFRFKLQKPKSRCATYTYSLKTKLFIVDNTLVMQ